MLSSGYFLPPCCYCHFISVIEFYCLGVDAYSEVKHFLLNLLWFLCGSFPGCWLHLLYFLSLPHPFLILFSQTLHTKCKMMSNNLQVISAPAVFIMFFFWRSHIWKPMDPSAESPEAAVMLAFCHLSPQMQPLHAPSVALWLPPAVVPSLTGKTRTSLIYPNFINIIFVNEKPPSVYARVF